MSTQTRTSAVDRFFDAVLERQTSLYDAVRSASERNHRFSRSIIEGVRQSNRDWTEVGRRFINKPTDLIGVYAARCALDQRRGTARGGWTSSGIACARPGGCRRTNRSARSPRR